MKGYKEWLINENKLKLKFIIDLAENTSTVCTRNGDFRLVGYFKVDLSEDYHRKLKELKT
jgi:hypothetical protein